MPNEKMHMEPCSFHKAAVTAFKWVLGMVIIIGGAGLSFAINEARDAKQVAESADKKADNVSVLENEVSHIRSDVSEINSRMMAINEMQIQMAEINGSMSLILEKVNQLERAD